MMFTRQRDARQGMSLVFRWFTFQQSAGILPSQQPRTNAAADEGLQFFSVFLVDPVASVWDQVPLAS